MVKYGHILSYLWHKTPNFMHLFRTLLVENSQASQQGNLKTDISQLLFKTRTKHPNHYWLLHFYSHVNCVCVSTYRKEGELISKTIQPNSEIWVVWVDPPLPLFVNARIIHKTLLSARTRTRSPTPYLYPPIDWPWALAGLISVHSLSFTYNNTYSERLSSLK